MGHPVCCLDGNAWVAVYTAAPATQCDTYFPCPQVSLAGETKQNIHLVSITDCLSHESLQNPLGPTARQESVTASAFWSPFSSLHLYQSHPAMTVLLRATGAVTSAERPHVWLSSLVCKVVSTSGDPASDRGDRGTGKARGQRRRVAGVS